MMQGITFSFVGSRADVKSVDHLDLETLPWEDKTGISSKRQLSEAFDITLALTTPQ